MKKGFVIGISLVLLSMASEVSADWLYPLDTGGYVAYGGAISPRAKKAELLSNGTLALLWDESPGSAGMTLWLVENYGASYSAVTDFPALDYQDPSTLFSFADTLWVLPSYANSTYDIWVREYRASTLFAVDTLGSDASSNGDRIGMAPVGGQWIWWHDVEVGATDSTNLWLTNGDVGSISSLAQKGQSGLVAAGVRLPTRGISNVGGGVLAWDNSGEDIRWGDTNGFAALALDVTGGIDLNIAGYAYGRLFSYGDSNLAFTYQNYANDQAGLWVRAGHFSSGATGSPSSVAWHGSGTQTLIASGSLRDTFPMCAQIVYLRRDPDSMWLFGRIPDNDSVNIVRWFSGDGGANWTGPVVRREGHVAAQRMFNLQMGTWANVDDTCVWFGGTFSDSVAAGSEIVYAWFDTVRLAASEPPVEETPSRRRTGILGSLIEDNFVQPYGLAARYFCIRKGF